MILTSPLDDSVRVRRRPPTVSGQLDDIISSDKALTDHEVERIAFVTLAVQNLAISYSVDRQSSSGSSGHVSPVLQQPESSQAPSPNDVLLADMGFRTSYAAVEVLRQIST
jgi:hypothetical protein